MFRGTARRAFPRFHHVALKKPEPNGRYFFKESVDDKKIARRIHNSISYPKDEPPSQSSRDSVPKASFAPSKLSLPINKFR